MILPAITNARRADREQRVGSRFWARPTRVIAPESLRGVGPAPDPVRDSDFVGGHGTGVIPSHRSIAFTLNRFDWALWEQDRFRGSNFKVYFRRQGARNGEPYGAQGPWGERENLEQGPPPEAYGSSVGVAPEGGEDYYFPGGR